MSWAGCQNNQIYVNFYLQKDLEIFEKNLADKIWSKKDKGIKVSPPVPNRVKVEKRGLLALHTLVCPLFVIPAYYLFFVPWFFFLPLLLFDETLSWWICWASENIRAVFVRDCSLGSYAMNKNISLGFLNGSIVRLLLVKLAEVVYGNQ